MLHGILTSCMVRLLELAVQVTDESIEYITRLVPLAEALGMAVGPF